MDVVGHNNVGLYNGSVVDVYVVMSSSLLTCCCRRCVQVVLVFLLSIASLIIYFIDSSTYVSTHSLFRHAASARLVFFMLLNVADLCVYGYIHAWLLLT